MKQEKYYAHRSEDGRKELLLKHLQDTASTCARFAAEIKLEKSGQGIGMLHDGGKYADSFQDRLLKDGPKCDHSTAGAKLIVQSEPEFGILWAYPIAGHHGGLMDWGSTETGLCYRLTNKDIPDFSAYKTEIKELPVLDRKEIEDKLKNKSKYQSFRVSFLIRMLYSCLVDADFLETERFIDVDKSELRSTHYVFDDLLAALMDHLSKLQQNTHKIKNESIRCSRQAISKQCAQAAEAPIGLFSLTVPTGGGKTLSGMLFALKHAIYNKLKRIIVVIPYTSIIEQNAKIYRDIFGIDFVLEHHSNFSFEPNSNEKTDDEYTRQNLLKLKYASENWDIAITVTTSVQFYESLFASKSSRSRKVHNMANAVIIIDEAQMMPLQYMKPCLLALNELVANYNSTVVLSTATQPAFPKGYLLNEMVEIINQPEQLYEAFRRTKIINLGKISDDNLIQHATKQDSYMIVVNRKDHAKILCQKIIENDPSKEKSVYHLTAMMCAAHRTDTLNEIKELLEKKAPCILVATNLVECGVDISFPNVYRAYSGLDSIIQTAGRCNRNGELIADEEGVHLGKVYVFEPADYKTPDYIVNQAETTRYILENFRDPLSLKAIKEYFGRLYGIDEARLDSKEIIEYCFESGNDLEYRFKTAAERFRIIESEMNSIIIPYNKKAKKLINEFRYSGSKKSLRVLQPYIVSIYEEKKNELLQQGLLEELLEGLYLLRDKSNYKDKYGLDNEMSFLEV